MRFGVLGPLAVWTDGGEAVRVPEAKVRLLLAVLLAAEGQTVSTDRLVEELWGDRPPRNPLGTLQARVSQLRKVLEDAEPGGRELVVSQPPGYALVADHTDAWQFAELVAQARGERDARARAKRFDDALALWRGSAFADFDIPARTGLEEARLSAIEEQAEARLEIGEFPVLGELVAEHPLRERLRAAHILGLYRAGRQAEALADYEALRRLLAEELGVDPSPELAALHASILRQADELKPDLEPDPKPACPTSNLPAVIGDLIGRERDVALARAELRGERLVTLTGPGGVGKTRLALEVAARSAREFPDGTWLVELAAGRPRDASELADLVAGALGHRDETDTSEPVERLAAALRPHRALLVLDNCEHVVDAVADLVGRLLATAPELTVLATSREPLGVAGERVRAVPPLGPGSAERLFAARAAAAAPGFAVTDANAAAVAAVCRRLDGLPLALELAATRVRALGVDALAARLDDRFRLLTRRGGPARQQTLRAMIDWSWELLSGPERVALRRLAVHWDGCTLQAAEEVCGDPGLDVLARLVDRSLVVFTEDGRYRLLESVSDYCLERLREAGEEELVRARHARYYTALAERAVPYLRGPEQERWLQLLDKESANFRAALEYRADPALTNALGWYWFLRGRLNEARRYLTLALAQDAPENVLRRTRVWLNGLTMLSGEGDKSESLREAALGPDADAWSLWFLTFVHWPYGDLPASHARLERTLEMFKAEGDRWGEAAALSTRAKLRMVGGDLADMERDAERALRLFGELGDAWGELEAADAVARHAEIVGDYGRAVRMRREVRDRAERLGMWAEVSFALAGLGRIAMLDGDLDEAHDLHERALTLARDRTSRSAEEFAAIGLALIARRRGDLDAAEAHLRGRLPWLRGIGGTAGIAFIHTQLGFVAEQRGDATAAADLHTTALAAARETDDPRAVALALEGLAGARSLAGDTAEASRLLTEAETIRTSVGAPLPPAERFDTDRIQARLTQLS
ncbi:BTAD domain-containing putative transcriptional regulator [Actinomadura rupiterrae]|uniref:BTAD domain-containing putative transcriptional regulator n=1 Tax=Actinomadura rupiterrae TaxID=559627 RepID=UPI0020A5B82C|nr:BTAD domain-containing putative transcriptional regulator [Actinomadura rupiterrae]MCP2336167.1 putative ATPase/DNA-binding SARP family transcriptional activator [Actinomadura rupiterrae]